MSDTSIADAAARAGLGRNDLEAYWMPFTANRQFKSAPRLLVGAKDMHYVMADGRRLLDGCAGLWCVNAGHCRDEIVAAITGQAARMDYATAFQMGHPDLDPLPPGQGHLPDPGCTLGSSRCSSKLLGTARHGCNKTSRMVRRVRTHGYSRKFNDQAQRLPRLTLE